MPAETPPWAQFGVMSDPVVKSLVAYPGGGVCYFNAHPHEVADAILNAAFASLGCSTPEAVAALRALVTAAITVSACAAHNAVPHFDGPVRENALLVERPDRIAQQLNALRFQP